MSRSASVLRGWLPMLALAAVCAVIAVALPLSARARSGGKPVPLRLSWAKNMLTISGESVPGGQIDVWYLEAFCRAGSTDRDWNETVVPHTTELISAADDRIRLRSQAADGLVLDHDIRSGPDEVDFRLTAINPTGKRSEVHWAQPCMRVDRFTGLKSERSSEAYLPKSFIFLDGRPARLPTHPWATKARYTPGQVWCPRNVPRDDVNPRPLSSLVPSNGLIGCYSADEKKILATAWEPYQELFQGIIVCLHSDFRLGGLQPGERKKIRGKIYVVDSDLNALVRRYKSDFGL